MSQTTVSRCRVLLSALFARACGLDLVEHNPVRDFQSPVSPKTRKKGGAYTPEEAETIIAILTGRAKVMAALCWYAGLRPEL